MAKTTAGRTSAKPQDDAISDVERGLTVPTNTAILTEDQKRAMGVDASQAEGVGDHDDSPEANRFGQSGGVIDTYAGMPTAEHANYAALGLPLVVGQAPQAPTAPMVGSPAADEQFDPNFPNAKNQSPVVRGVEMDPRNDPSHPQHDQADRRHPDYGKPAFRHVGRRTQVPSYNDLKVEAAERDVAKASEPATA